LKARDQVRLGRTSLSVTRLGLGTSPLAGLYRAVEETDALSVIHSAWNAGIRFYDTAPLYGHGLAEQRLGRVLREKRRDEFTLATKVGRLLRAGASAQSGQSFDGSPSVNPVFDFTYDGVMRSVEESRGRLGIDQIDILHIHDPDAHYDEALAGAYRALAKLRSDGEIRAVAAGMNQTEMLARFAREADFDCFLLAGRYTLLDQIALKELLPLCLDRGVAIIAAGVYNSGILADPKPGTHYNYELASADLIERANRIRVVCERYAVPLRAAAVQFPLGHPAVQTVVVGCRTVQQMQDTVRMFETSVPPELWLDLKSEGLLPEEAPTT
jgi:D-threo-aldose 1-dehydrogenase